MTDPFASAGAKSPAKPFTIEEGHRKVRSFVLRRAAGKAGAEEFRRVATRGSNPPAGSVVRLHGDD